MKYRYFSLIVLLYLPFTSAENISVESSGAEKVSAEKSVRLIIPGPTAPFKVGNLFIEQLLDIIFLKQNLTLDLVYEKEHITQGRALKELNNDAVIDLTWSVTTSAREQSLTPIRIPLYQGLIGWRVFIINKHQQEKFDEINNLAALGEMLAIQRFDWPDYQVFIENNLNVDGNLAFSQMYKAIENGLADYFPRSVLEVTRELKSINSNKLAIEKSVLLKYPSSYYFFVGKQNPELAQTIKKGFELALADGSYQRLFQQHFGKTLAALKLDDRKVLHLSSSLLSGQ